MFKIEYDKNDSITRLSLHDKLTKSEVEQLTRELLGYLSDNKILLLTDARNVSFEFDIKDLQELLEVTDKYFIPDIMVYDAVIIATPRETVITTLFTNKNERDNHIVRIFSTESAALSWLLNYK